MRTPRLPGLAILAVLLIMPAAGRGAPAQDSSNTAPAKLTYVDLVKRLTDLEYLATLPQPGEMTAQWSSYDRASRYDEKTGRYLRWDANNDGNGIIRREDGKLVLAEMQGPGCIWRIWSAAPKAGHVRIFLDGSSEPAVDLPFAGYFDGKNEPFTRPALVHTVASGWNNYTPIPYQKSCRIVADAGWGQYYQFVYGTLPAGTQVPTFKRQLSPEADAALDEANRILSDCGPHETGEPAPGETHTAVLAADGGSATFVTNGPGAIILVRVRMDLPPPPADRDPLREVVIEMRWDGEKAPSVWAPLGDFFGTAPGVNLYRSLPCGMTADGWFYANWFMPFARGAEIRFINQGGHEQRLQYEIRTEPVPGDLSRYGRFHAKWHRDDFLPTRIDREIDWPLLIATGRGRYVGVELHVWNPRGGWWGEGDEKFFVDGEKFPSTFGTGSEDYFGYAWCDPGLFQQAYHNQTHNDGWNRGHVSVNRWQIADQVPFQKRFEADIEKYFPNGRPTLYDATVYWYLDPAGFDPYSSEPVEERTGYYIQPAPKRVPNAIEGESLTVLGRTGGNPRPQDMAGFGDQWSNDSQLWWTDARPGDTLQLALPVAKADSSRSSPKPSITASCNWRSTGSGWVAPSTFTTTA
jgi:hypothetical protein